MKLAPMVHEGPGIGFCLSWPQYFEMFLTYFRELG